MDLEKFKFSDGLVFLYTVYKEKWELSYMLEFLQKLINWCLQMFELLLYMREQHIFVIPGFRAVGFK